MPQTGWGRHKFLRNTDWDLPSSHEAKAERPLQESTTAELDTMQENERGDWLLSIYKYIKANELNA